jgi:hypothetical protein
MSGYAANIDGQGLPVGHRKRKRACPNAVVAATRSGPREREGFLRDAARRVAGKIQVELSQTAIESTQHDSDEESCFFSTSGLESDDGSEFDESFEGTAETGRRWQDNAALMAEGRLQERQGHVSRIQASMDITEQELRDKLDECKRREDEDGDANSTVGGNQDDNQDDNQDNFDRIRGGESYFDDRGKSVAKALLLFYLNSGMMRFNNHREYMECWDGEPVDIDGLLSEIKNENPSDDDTNETLREFFLSHRYTEGCLPSCGCGITKTSG